MDRDTGFFTLHYEALPHPETVRTVYEHHPGPLLSYPRGNPSTGVVPDDPVIRSSGKGQAAGLYSVDTGKTPSGKNDPGSALGKTLLVIQVIFQLTLCSLTIRLWQ